MTPTNPDGLDRAQLTEGDAESSAFTDSQLKAVRIFVRRNRKVRRYIIDLSDGSVIPSIGSNIRLDGEWWRVFKIEDTEIIARIPRTPAALSESLNPKGQVGPTAKA